MSSTIKNGAKFRLTPVVGGAIVVALLLIVYAGAYAVRSRDGHFEPVTVDLGGTVYYRWAPAGFVTNRRWNNSQVIFYYPLYLIDIRFWHVGHL